jgi:hypothetical protein
MAEVINSEVMDLVLDNQNWALATQSFGQYFATDKVFPKPLPPPPPALMVPIDLQALYVPPRHNERYVRLPMELGEGAQEAKPTEPFSTPKERKEGIHLHWAMPDGLLRGEMVDDPAQPIKMHPLPDRWLITRTTGQRGARIVDVKSWVIEADSGKVFDLENYPGDPVATLKHEVQPKDLTGIIGGSPNWTTSYDAALNRFAFHDPLDDLDAGRVLTKQASYSVIGWWSEPALDPLSNVFSPYSVHRKIEQFGWTASSAPTVAVWQSPVSKFATEIPDVAVKQKPVDVRAALKLTTAQAGLELGFVAYEYDRVTLPLFLYTYETVLHGAIHGVPLVGGISKDAAPRASRIKLSLAPTLERLMAAQAAKGLGANSASEKEYLESLLTAVANGSLINLGARDGIVALDEAEHGDGFETFRGPETYVDVVIERKQSALKAGRPLRTKAARKKSDPQPKAEIIWNGSSRGKQKATDAEMRSLATEVMDRTLNADILDSPVIKRINRPGPRYHRQTAPVIGLRDYGKPNRFLEDGRFHDDGKLVCRWTEELGCGFGDAYQTKDFVPEIKHSDLPGVTNRIIHNAFLMDPYILPWTFAAIDKNAQPELRTATKNRVRSEIALRYSPDGAYDGTVPIARQGNDVTPAVKAAVSNELLRFSIYEGREPSPVSISTWVQPWSPVWLEWEIALEPGQGFDGWLLERIEFTGAPKPNGKVVKLRGRSAITSGLARSFQSVINTYLIAEKQRDEAGAGEIGEGHAQSLAKLAGFLQRSDLGSVTLDRVNDLWLGLENGPDGQVYPAPANVAEDLQKAGLPRLIADGTLRLSKARIIDSFGRYRDLATNNPTLPAALRTKSKDGKWALAMPPRLALPARLMWRFVDPADAGPNPKEARLDQATPDRTISPVSGYILPDFFDESLEFFDQDGMPLGEVLHDPVTGGMIWEGAVGRDGPVSASPMDGLPASARLCGQVAQGMIDVDILQRNTAETAEKESPLSAFLRAVDTTMWSVDSSLASAGASIAGLVGRPIAVVSTQLWLDIPQDLSKTGAFGKAGDDIRDHLIREAVFDAVKSSAFRIRLGELAKGHDGLYGFYIGQDFEQFHLIDKGVRASARVSHAGSGFRSLLDRAGANVGASFLPAPSPIDTPYITAGAPLEVHSGQVVRVTLLMHPSARVHATTGFLPRKSLELVRDWVADGLGRVAPSARIGPVLIDPDKVRLPKIAAFGANQSWTRRGTPITWRDDPILAATQAAILPTGRVTVEEGYIRITPDGETSDGGGN